MPSSPAIPFTLLRARLETHHQPVTSIVEEVHGVLRLASDHIVIQWRTRRHRRHAARDAQRHGIVIGVVARFGRHEGRAGDAVDRMVDAEPEVSPIREVAVPVSWLAAPRLRRRWRLGPPRWELVLRAVDLRAFAEVAGESPSTGDRPGELVLHLQRSDRTAAVEFIGEMELALADHALRTAGGEGS